MGNGEVMDKYKALLVARGFTQVEGMDFEEAFAPVVRFTSVRVLLATVAAYDMDLHQIDVVEEFLNGDLHEEICIEQPEGFAIKGMEHKV